MTSPFLTSTPSSAFQSTFVTSGDLIGSTYLNMPSILGLPSVLLPAPTKSTTNADSKLVKQKFAIKKIPTKRPSCGRLSTRLHCLRRGRGGEGSESGFRLSPRMKNASTRLPAQIAEAVHPGPAAPHQSALTAPSAGPRIKPSPKAIPMSPICLDRSSGGETSAM